VQDKLREIVSVKDFGARGDGETDDTTAIQAALESGARRVVFPPGRYVTGRLTMPDWMHIEGESYQPTIGGDGRAVELRFNLKSGVGLSCGANPVIRNIFFQNTGGQYDESRKALKATQACAVALTENAVIDECSFSLWQECIRTGASTFYLKTSRLHFNRCTIGYRAAETSPYNLHIDSPHSTFTDIFLTGEGEHYPRNVKVFGGSIEGYAQVARHFSEISFFGTYFETDHPNTNVVAIQPGLNGASVALFGCLVFMNRTARFVSMDGLTDAMLTSVGNTFDGIGQARGACFHLPLSGSVSLAGDRFGNKHPKDCLYVDSISAAARFNLCLPDLPEDNVQHGFGGMQIIGPKGFVMQPLSEEPVMKIVGATVFADGVRWNPLNRPGGRPYWTVWQSDRWGAVG
jgi:hypothetical protein